MNLLNKLTIKNLKLNKKRTIVTIIGIMLSVALITAVTSIYSSGIKSLINFETFEKGNFHAAFYDVPTPDLNIFKNNREIAEINITQNIGYAKINSQNEDKPYAYIKAFTKNALHNLSLKLVEGRLPENPNEIVIPTHLKTNGRLTLNVGDSITLNIGKRMSLVNHVELDQSNPFQSNDYLEEELEQNTISEENIEKAEDIVNPTPKTYKIVGIIERPATNIEIYSAPGYTFITYLNENDLSNKIDIYARYTKNGTKNAYEITAGILGVNETFFKKNYKGTGTLEEIKKYLNEEKPKQKYEYALNSYLIDLETNPLSMDTTGELAIVVLIVMGIIVFTSVFCIKNSFDISITEKIKQYGMLKSIGATKKQIKKNVFYEATILGLIGIPLGLISGLFASYILIIVSNYFLRDSLAIGVSLEFTFSITAIIIAILLGIVTIYLSALKSAKRTSKISPITSIRNSANIKINPKKIKSPKFIKKIFGMGGEISYKNLKRNKKKYRTTVISIVVSVFVFIALSSFMNMAFEAVNNELKIAEYNVSLYSHNLTKESYNKYLASTKLNNIENYTVLREIGFNYQNRELNPEYIDFLHLKINDNASEYINIYALGETQYQKYLKTLNLKYEEFKDKGILMDYMKVGYQKSDNTQNKKSKMVYKTLRYTNFKPGTILTGTLENGQNKQIEIGFITNEKPFGLKNYQNTYLVVSEELFNQIFNNNYQDLTIFYKSNNANVLQDDLDELLKGENYSINNIEENAQVMNNLYTLIGIFLYGFIIVISLIGITNIFNTITTNMELRRQEFAMLKSIGMTSKEFSHMIKLETFFMGIKSLIFGIPIGLFLSYLIYHFLAEPSGIPYKFPIIAIIIAVGVVFILISLIMKYSMNKINKQNTIETIRNENI